METPQKSGCLTRLGSLYQTIAILLLNTTLLLLAMELFGAIIIPPLEEKGHQAQLTFQQQSGAAAGEPWLNDYWREHYLLQNEYHPYVIWRPAPFQGETITIDGEGLRITPGATCEPGAYTVFMFGGSTMWGYGVPDWATIPAYIQEKLSAERDMPVCVRNFGQAAFVSTQGVIELLAQLQQENVPDVVIFYDGINDVGGAYQYGRITHLLEETVAHQLYARTYLTDWVKSSYSYQLAGVAGRKVQEWVNLPQPDPYAPVVDDLDALADEAIAAYLANYYLVAGLSEQYGFEFYFIWQPCLTTYTGELLSDQQLLVQGYPAQYVQFFRDAYHLAKTRSANYPHLYYEADALRSLPENVWIDPQHLNPTGNEQMAEVILQVIR